MLQRDWNRITAACALLGLLVALTCTSGVNAGSGSVVTFNDRSSWNSAVGGTPGFLVDFEDFSADAIFGLAPVDAGPLTLAQSSGIPNFFTRVDVPPYFAFIAAGNSPNGSTFAMSVLGNSSVVGDNKVEITFDEPQIAFGADFKNNPNQSGNDFAANQLVLDTPSGPITTSIDTTDGFFGFIAPERFSKVTFQLNPSAEESSTSFGMDNVVGVARLATPVEIDIKPGSSTNPINLSKPVLVPVAIVTTDSFDATTVDPNTVCFGDDDNPDERDCTEAHRRGHIADMNGDGRADLVLHYEVNQTGIDEGDTTACLTGGTFGGASVEGCDAITTV
jgi:hypothetical protein